MATGSGQGWSLTLRGKNGINRSETFDDDCGGGGVERILVFAHFLMLLKLLFISANSEDDFGRDLSLCTHVIHLTTQ